MLNTHAISDKTVKTLRWINFYSATVVISKALKLEVINNVYDVTIQRRRQHLLECSHITKCTDWTLTWLWKHKLSLYRYRVIIVPQLVGLQKLITFAIWSRWNSAVARVGRFLTRVGSMHRTVRGLAWRGGYHV